eukprot:13830852-Ditylum_brightwellii.AAC.1
MSTFSMEEVHIKFLHKMLPHVDGEPMYASVPTILGGGTHIHIGLAMNATSTMNKCFIPLGIPCLGCMEICL